MVPNSQSVMCSIPHLGWLPHVLSYLSSLLFSLFSVVLVYSYQVWGQFIRPHTSHVRDSSIVEAISEKLYKIVYMSCVVSAPPPLSWLRWCYFYPLFQFPSRIIVFVYSYLVCGQFIRLYTFHVRDSPIVHGVREKLCKIVYIVMCLRLYYAWLPQIVIFILFPIFSFINGSRLSILGVRIVYIAIHPPCL